MPAQTHDCIFLSSKNAYNLHEFTVEPQIINLLNFDHSTAENI